MTKTHTLEVTGATYLDGLRLSVRFNDGTEKVVDFQPFLQRHPHPQYDRYRQPEAFRNFSIEHGNLVWGRNWDLVFPVSQLHSGVISL